MTTELFEKKLITTVTINISKITLLKKIKDGTVPREQLKDFSIALYGEARSSLRIKIPERIKMCPLELGSVRKFWCKMLKEESGGFQKKKDHATLIIPTCKALGANDAELYKSYLRACKQLENFNERRFFEFYSIKKILTELTRMWIDEYILALEATNIAEALKKYYSLSEDDVFYFRLHAIEDIKHSKAGLNEILKIAKTDDLQKHVFEKSSQAIENFPIWEI